MDALMSLASARVASGSLSSTGGNPVLIISIPVNMNISMIGGMLYTIVLIT